VLIGAKDEERNRRGEATGRGGEIKPNPYRGKQMNK